MQDESKNPKLNDPKELLKVLAEKAKRWHLESNIGNPLYTENLSNQSHSRINVIEESPKPVKTTDTKIENINSAVLTDIINEKKKKYYTSKINQRAIELGLIPPTERIEKLIPQTTKETKSYKPRNNTKTTARLKAHKQGKFFQTEKEVNLNDAYSSNIDLLTIFPKQNLAEVKNTVTTSQLLSFFPEGSEKIEEHYESIEEPYESIEKPYESIEKPYECIEKPYESIEEPYECIEKPYESIEEPYECIEKPYESIEKPYESNEEISYQYVLFTYFHDEWEKPSEDEFNQEKPPFTHFHKGNLLENDLFDPASYDLEEFFGFKSK